MVFEAAEPYCVVRLFSLVLVILQYPHVHHQLQMCPLVSSHLVAIQMKNTNWFLEHPDTFYWSGV